MKTKLGAAPAKLRAHFGRLGGFDGSLYLIKRGVETLSRGTVRLYRYYLVVQPVNEAAVLPAHRGRSIEVFEATPREVAAIPVDRPRAVFEDRFRQGARCLVARTQGRFVGFLWFVVGPYDEDEVRCRFVPLPAATSAWDFDVFVDPQARFGLALPRLWDEANMRLSSLGVRRSMSRISAFNAESLAAHRRLGSTMVGSATFLRAGPVQLMMSTLAPYLHVSLRPRSQPTLRIEWAGGAAAGPA